MKRVRIGVRLRIGIFPNGAVYVKIVTDDDAKQGEIGVSILRRIFPSVPFVYEVGEVVEKKK